MAQRGKNSRMDAQEEIQVVVNQFKYTKEAGSMDTETLNSTFSIC